MKTRRPSGRLSAAAFRLSVAVAVGATATAVVATPTVVHAQATDTLAANVDPGAQMLLEADTLIFDNDSQTVTASGAVQIDYGGNRLVAQEVSYDRNTGRLRASGNVEIIEKDGNRIYTDEIDITDDFGEGFVNALRVETTDNTRFAAESAERTGGNVTTFNQGVYTACEACEEHPNRPPIWRIKSHRIIWNSEEQTITFKYARLELFGLPIAGLPWFQIPDPTVKRKSGFLIPTPRYSSELGFGVNVPYYLALGSTYDLLLSPTYYSKQGFLAEALFRQRFNNGEYNLKIAGIDQKDPDAFEEDPNSSNEEKRGMIGSKGRFDINPRWVFGWDVLFQSDKNFSRAYNIGGYSDLIQRSEVYLTGLNDRNFFDLRFMRFQIQETILNSSSSARHKKQPWVLPSFDYSVTPDEPIAGGELNFDMNMQILNRERLDDNAPTNTVVRGVAGKTGRLSAAVEWKRNYVTDAGLVITPLLALQGDAILTDITSPSAASINAMATNLGVAADIRRSYYRYMATAGLEVRWPILFSTTSAMHVLEPMAQVFARPNAPYEDTLGTPNEDAQSFVFDASTLFERDKFSGWDRIEGGTRANVGVRYTGTFANGWTAHGLFGQSYHLAGRNSFAQPDLVNVGASSGLETDQSDFVGMLGFATPNGFSASVGARFDEKTFKAQRLETKARWSGRLGTIYGSYTSIEPQPLYGLPTIRREVQAGASLNFHDNWSVFGSTTYDLISDTETARSLGLSYHDECFVYRVTYTQTTNTVSQEVTKKFGFFISLRTIGDFGSDTGALGLDDDE